MNDLPRTYMEPLLYMTACARRARDRMSTEYVIHVQDEAGATVTCLDRLSN